ncbi:hypothetical protein F4560_007715 [Saccharothrix ecbatanensis]|uniref:Uncharacterized protein n=1 Tax=Saccharothrix ecbatanensis TaxID=1105145 RepID=A0A7W9HT02_9PSEU|nr:hypothetical protein [Saccharothrix ecbatanensis]MBB5807947.1 hypothetical protein [Saccharothrix ecbatanensis]
MSEEVPTAVANGRKVSMALLAIAVAVTVLLALWLVASWVTAPAVV